MQEIVVIQDITKKDFKEYIDTPNNCFKHVFLSQQNVAPLIDMINHGDFGSKLFIFDALDSENVDNKYLVQNNEFNFIHHKIREKIIDDLLCFCENDAHAETFSRLNYENMTYLVSGKEQNGADTVLNQKNIRYKRNDFTIPSKAKLLILGNDWGEEAQLLINQARKENLNIVAIQEGMVGFDQVDAFYNSDIVNYLGVEMLKYVLKRLNFVTGNPRFDNYNLVNQEKVTDVLININQAYGFGESDFSEWLTDVESLCKELNLSYKFLLHPRDNSDMIKHPKAIKSNFKIAQEELRRAKIVISRKSTLIYEAIMLNVPVIYYDKFNELNTIVKDNTYIDKYFIATDNSQLKAKLENIINPTAVETYILSQKIFSNYHLMPDMNKSTEYFINSLEIIEEFEQKFTYRSKIDVLSKLYEFIHWKYLKLFQEKNMNQNQNQKEELKELVNLLKLTIEEIKNSNLKLEEVVIHQNKQLEELKIENKDLKRDIVLLNQKVEKLEEKVD